MKYEIKYKELKGYLESLKRSDFERDGYDNENIKMKSGHSINDIIRFKIDQSKITLDTVIDYGTPFLVDAIGNDLSIIWQTRRAYKLPTGRLVKGKFDRTLIKDCRELYGTPLNGYWIIPDKFLIKKFN